MTQEQAILILISLLLVWTAFVIHSERQRRQHERFWQELKWLRWWIGELEKQMPSFSISASASASPSPSEEIPDDEELIENRMTGKKDPNCCRYCGQPFEGKEKKCSQCGAPRRS